MRKSGSWRGALRALWIAAVLVVIVGSLLPAASAPMRALGWLGINDKVEHFLAYLTLALLPALHERSKFLVGAAVGAVVLGIALEYGQRLSPGRDFEFKDMEADAAGVCIGLAVGLALRATTPIGPFFRAK
jgi:VanZ family protein